MNQEVLRKSAVRIPDLRKKELLSKLTSAEQQELDRLRQIELERYPDRTTEQYADKVRLMAIRNFTVVDATAKESFFQKMFNKENPKEYRLHFTNEEEDVAEYMFPYAVGLDIRQWMDDAGLALDWPKMLPVDYGMCYTDPLEDDDKQWFENFPDPAWCTAKLRDVKSVDENAGQEAAQVIDWMRTHWGNGYQIYADIDPWEEDDL